MNRLAWKHKPVAGKELLHGTELDARDAQVI
jgi:hypothetical protein